MSDLVGNPRDRFSPFDSNGQNLLSCSTCSLLYVFGLAVIVRTGTGLPDIVSHSVCLR